MQAGRLPKRFPVGTKYVVEGKSHGEGQVQIFSRYLVFPDGSCLDLPSDAAEFEPRRRANAPSSLKKH
jgi:hypothetical protein